MQPQAYSMVPMQGMGQTDAKQPVKYIAMAAAGIAAFAALAYFLSRKSDSNAAPQAFTPNASKKRHRMSKGELVSALSDYAGLQRSDVRRVLEAMPEIAKKELKKSGGEIAIPGVVKLRTVKKKATKARKGRNPATGEEITIKAKKASRKVKATPLKPVQEAVVPAPRKAG